MSSMKKMVYIFVAVSTAVSAVPFISKATEKSFNVDEASPLMPSFVAFEDTTPAGMTWQKVEALSDEFNQSWDASKWKRSNWNYSDTPVNMVDTNSGVENGYLWISATLDDSTEESWFKTSRVHSKAKISFPMYTETRLKVAHIAAYNTFWLNNGDADNRDEIDIIEINSDPTCGENDEYPWQMNSQYFIVKNGETERNKGPWSTKKLSDANTRKGVTWNQDYHVFGAWWKDEHNVQFYLNGEPAGHVVSSQPFTLQQELIWDLWTQDSSWVCGLPEKEDLLDHKRNTMKVDWVRTWKLVSK
ncbi:family 16 glycosylhydrolase [Alteromonas stellipolaris]|uniref:family 16 glycosylhydrolase n=1 Tax=Alteromonas stellipolaris TaxID=233316 RepID=UPI0026E479ED|nr:family 16 glycosylhydrolase [Alteromonas stellipolaris]MDO6537306.1 family 16 glycosylhydrolase [Alteromonas stellipolaris]